MKLKEKFVKEKLLTDRPQFAKHADSTPLLARLENQYLFHNANFDSVSNYHRKKSTDKENVYSMINSVPASQPQHQFKNTIKIDNYEGRRFKTQTGYEPALANSKYEGYPNDRDREEMRLHQSQEQFKLQKKRQYSKGRRYENIELNNEGDRPLTFGLIKQNEPLKSSVQYRQDRKLKNEVLDEISQLRKSQQGLLASKQYSTNEEDFMKCSNHNNKKAKYRLITDDIKMEDQSEEEMLYCSKCAINLLQQGFKVEEIKKEMGNTMMKKSKNFGHSRLQEMRKFQEKLCEVQVRLHQELSRTESIDEEIELMDRDKKETEMVYELLIDMLKQIKLFELRKLNNNKEKKIIEYNKNKQVMVEQLQNVQCIRRQLKEYRNKFIIMKEQEFQFLINSFLNQVHEYGKSVSPFEQSPLNAQAKIQKILSTLDRAARQRVENEEVEGSMKNGKNDEFVCSEIKRPFRTLFPDQESECENLEESQFPNIMEVSEENDSPSFQKIRRKH